MVNFKTLTKDCSDMTGYLFSFPSQRSVVYYSGGNKYLLSKLDVVGCINYYINLIHRKFSVHVRCEGMNYSAFKMYDLVPYLYTLINYYYCLLSGFDGYRRTNRKLELTRFCHLPFEDEIIEVPKKEDLNIQCALLDDPFGVSRYCCVISGVPVCGSSLDALLHIISHRFPNFVKKYELHFVSP